MQANSLASSKWKIVHVKLLSDPRVRDQIGQSAVSKVQHSQFELQLCGSSVRIYKEAIDRETNFALLAAKLCQLGSVNTPVVQKVKASGIDQSIQRDYGDMQWKLKSLLH